MYKTGDKFIVEIDRCIITEDCDSGIKDVVYGLKEINNFCLTAEEIDKIIPCNSDAAYIRGLNDAWDAARKIGGIGEGVIPCKDLQRLFGVDVSYYIFKNTEAFDAVQIVREYEEEKEAEQEIKVGDELISEDGERTVIIDIEYKTWRVFDGYETTDIYDFQKIHWKKTGRHFPQISEVLKQMQES